MAPSTHLLALQYGLRLDASPEFIQGYVDGMRLDQRGQGVACGKGWIPRSKKCSRDKASQTSKEAKAKTVEKAKERAKLKGEVKAAKGQKAQERKSPKKQNNGLAKDASTIKRWLDSPLSQDQKMPPEVAKLTEKAREMAIKNEREVTAELYKRFESLDRERFGLTIVDIPGTGHFRQATAQEVSDAARRLNEQREQKRKATIAGILDGTKTVDLSQDAFDLAYEAQIDYESTPQSMRKGSQAERIYQQAQQLLKESNDFMENRSILTLGNGDNWREELNEMGYSDWGIASQAESVLNRAAKKR